MVSQNSSSRGRQSNDNKRPSNSSRERTSKSSDTKRKYVAKRDDDSKSFSKSSKKDFKETTQSKPRFSTNRKDDTPRFSKDNRNDRPSFDRKRQVREEDSPKKLVKKRTIELKSTADQKPARKRISVTKEAKPTDFKNKFSKTKKPTFKASDASTRLNKYIANSGICSRREADLYIKAGNVTINGKVVTEMGYQVMPEDVVKFDNNLINPEPKRYVLLNKPKDYITTLEDERGRKTVMDLVVNAAKERIYPVGRLDRNTTGLLLFTNDGDMAKKLTHPKFNVHKLYHVTLDKNVTAAHMKQIVEPSFKIEDIPVYVDQLSYVEGSSKNEIGIEIHSGRNRIVRKIFESLGYSVVKLDRVVFAGLTKKDLPKGKWRHLSEQEIINLRMIK